MTLLNMGEKSQTFEDLIIWQEGMKLCYEIYNALADCRDYGLRNQMERSVVSIPSNIAEGYELCSDRAFVRHLYISKGSTGELRTQLYIAIQQKYVSEEVGHQLLASTISLSKMLQKFIEARKKRNTSAFFKRIILFLFFQ